MTYFPQPQVSHPAAAAPGTYGPVRQAIMRDILWNQPVFKAPALPNPRIAFDPLPFTAARVTQRSAQR